MNSPINRGENIFFETDMESQDAFYSFESPKWQLFWVKEDFCSEDLPIQSPITDLELPSKFCSKVPPQIHSQQLILCQGNNFSNENLSINNPNNLVNNPPSKSSNTTNFLLKKVSKLKEEDNKIVSKKKTKFREGQEIQTVSQDCQMSLQHDQARISFPNSELVIIQNKGAHNKPRFIYQHFISDTITSVYFKKFFSKRYLEFNIKTLRSLKNAFIQIRKDLKVLEGFFRELDAVLDVLKIHNKKNQILLDMSDKEARNQEASEELIQKIIAFEMNEFVMQNGLKKFFELNDRASSIPKKPVLLNDRAFYNFIKNSSLEFVRLLECEMSETVSLELMEMKNKTIEIFEEHMPRTKSQNIQERNMY